MTEEERQDEKTEEETKGAESTATKEEEDEDEEKVEDKDDDVDDEPQVQLRVEIRHDDDKEDEKDEEPTEKASIAKEEKELLKSNLAEPVIDPKVAQDMEYISRTEPTSRLEIALTDTLKRKDVQIDKLMKEIGRFKKFISKRKQTYKRKRKDEGAPTRALSAYNIFIQDRFAKLAKENQEALHSTDLDAQMKRVPPANLVASTGNVWKELPAEEKAKYEERAKADRKRYEEQMAAYQPPDKQSNRKRNKTGYNMFFSAHVLRLKQSEQGVPSERGSVARLVGLAWKALSMEEKQYYEREADKHNGMHPVEKEGEEDEDDVKREGHVDPYAGHIHPGHEIHMQMHGSYQGAQHDPRHHGYAYPPHMYGQPPPHPGYDYYGHHHRQGARPPQGYQAYPPQQGHYDQRM